MSNRDGLRLTQNGKDLSWDTHKPIGSSYSPSWSSVSISDPPHMDGDDWVVGDNRFNATESDYEWQTGHTQCGDDDN
jgi:hypothetical protein